MLTPGGKEIKLKPRVRAAYFYEVSELLFGWDREQTKRQFYKHSLSPQYLEDIVKFLQLNGDTIRQKDLIY